MNMLFEPYQLGVMKLNHRIIRAATCECMGLPDGTPTDELKVCYEQLIKGGVELIVTGFSFISQEGRAMQRKQCGIESDKRIKDWKPIVDHVHSLNGKIVLQIAHTGRQTMKAVTGQSVVSSSNISCSYFKEKPKKLSEKRIYEIIDEFGAAALRAQKAGFDGVEVHGAHGYLIHQFLSPYTNRRCDSFGGTEENRFSFLKLVLEKIRTLCSSSFVIMVKLSIADDRGMTQEDCEGIVSKIDRLNIVDGIEISYGTMEYSINIFRGAIPVDRTLKINPLFSSYPTWVKKIWKRFIYPSFKKKFIPYADNYNFECSKKLPTLTKIPIFLTGGIRKVDDMNKIINAGFAGVSLSRPFIIEPDFIKKIKADTSHRSECIHCNICAVMCDSLNSTRCYVKNP